jgi:hypothetical protein
MSRTITKAEQAMHLETVPRMFAGRKLDGRSHGRKHS